MRKAFAFLSLLFALPLFAQTASFVKSDTTTSGAWMGSYGADGHYIEAGTAIAPSYLASLSESGNSTYTWETGASSPQDLSGTAACWYSATNFSFNLNITGTHQVSFYLLDWDNYAGGRKETIQVTTPAGAVLASQSYSGFTKGVYAVFSISGQVSVNVINQNPSGNAVVSGVFFDTSGTVTPKHSLTLNWLGGSGPFNVYRIQYLNGIAQPPVKITLTPLPATVLTFTDTTVQAGQTYTFTVTSFLAGVESAPATITAFTIPSP
jgi:hypothetical protein